MKTLRTTLVIAAILLLSPFTSYSQSGNVTLEYPNSATSLEVVQKYLNALQNGNVDAMNSQFSRDAMIYNLGGAPDSLNIAQHKEFYTNSTSQFTHKISRDLYLPVKVTDNWNEGEWVLTWGVNTVTDKTTKKTIEIPYHVAYMVKDGKINQAFYYYDMLNILEKQGYSVTAAEK